MVAHQLDRRDIDRKISIDDRAILLVPFGEHLGRLADRPLAERDDEPRILGDRDEFGRRDPLAAAVVPARERLASGDAAARYIDPRRQCEMEPVFLTSADPI